MSATLASNTEGLNISDLNQIRTVSTPEPAVVVDTTLYQTLSGAIGLIVIYLFVSLCCYEVFSPHTTSGGKKLRIPCILAAMFGVFYAIVKQLVISISSLSPSHCHNIAVAEITVFLIFISLSYAFFWARQHTIYGNPKLKHLNNTFKRVMSYAALILIIVNPPVLIGIQFTGPVYQIRNGVCTYLEYPSNWRTVFDVVAFSYGFIQVSGIQL